ncbi:MAG: phenylacetic acid degradation protein PaaY [Betaproteobacteria bacterium]|nr:phenylacetic acid degradation protein PaaY [Betaproteobacteria bacterium]MBI2960002.1 phenylacetic acid degradation protein PaaY [Betaproteobacteria bacterium]
MLKVYSIDGITPVVHPSAYVHPSAVLIGDVIVEAGVFVGPCASLRGDFGRLVVKQGANIQDCCIVHGFPDADTVIGKNGHIGHGAIIHGAVIGDNALIGMNAVINDYAEVGEEAIVAALAFVKAQMKVPPRTLVAGIPGRVVRKLTQTELDWKAGGTRLYQNLTLRSLATMRRRAPLAKESARRKRFNLPELLPLSELKKKPPK